MLMIAYDVEESTKGNPRYLVCNSDDCNSTPIYKGKYVQCLVVVGALTQSSTATIEEIRKLSDGFI